MAGSKGLNSTGKSSNSSFGGFGNREFVIQDAYGTAIPYGDPVTLASGFIVLCAENQTPIGVLRGVRYIDSTGAVVRQRNFVAGTSNLGLLTFEGGETGNVVAEIELSENRTYFIDASDAAVTAADIGTSKRLKTVGTADALGNSTAVVDMDATVSTETRLVRILGVASIPGNALGQSDATLEVEFVNNVGDAT